jgi:ornithine cyclodeaminase/alanine dehydrogenase-like protein (mu-crystallin family)
MPLILTESDIRSVLSTPDLIEAMEAVLIEYSRGRTQQPLRTVLEVGAQKAFFGVMPAFVPAISALGTKLVTVYGSNQAIGLPTHLATIVMLDPATGEPHAFLDGRYITEARTAAVSAVSTRCLARPDAGTLAIIGSGVQARSHVEAIGCVRTLRDIRVWSPNPDHRAQFASELADRVRPATLSAVSTPEAALAGAEIIVLATSSRTPVVRNEWVSDGAHICAVGACRPDQREMDGDLVGRARLFVDSRTGAMAEAGDIVLAMAEGVIDANHIAGELGEVAEKKVEGRRGAHEVTLFKSLGMAVEDVAAAQLACARARKRGLGQHVSF